MIRRESDDRVVARTVIADVLLTAIIGCTAMPGMRISWLSVRQLAGSAFEI
jgi:hypothetical protein